MTLKPFDGTAVILHLIEAARALKANPDPQDTEGWYATYELNQWTARLETYLAEQIPDEQPVGWEPRTWGEVVPGDTVNAGGGELLVAQAARLQWHVEPDARTGVRQVWHPGYDAVDEETGGPAHCRGCRGRCGRGRGYQMFPLEHEQMAVTLSADGQERAFKMPTDGEIEVLRGERGREIDRQAGRGAGTVKADRDMVLASWAAEAFQVLAANGFDPEPQVMTCATD